MFEARKVLATFLSAFIIFSWAYMVGWTLPSALPEYVASGCFMTVGFLVAFAAAYLVWPQRKVVVDTQPPLRQCQSASDAEEWERFLKNYRNEFAELPGME